MLCIAFFFHSTRSNPNTCIYADKADTFEFFRSELLAWKERKKLSPLVKTVHENLRDAKPKLYNIRWWTAFFNNRRPLHVRGVVRITILCIRIVFCPKL